MKKITLIVIALAAVAPSFAITLAATNNYVIETIADGYTYQDGSSSNYMNFGVAGGTHKALASLDFDATTLGSISSLTSAKLTLQESDYSSTRPFTAPIKVWAVTNNTVNLSKYNATTNPGGNQTVAYDDTVLGGYSGQLGTATLLGSFAFTSSAATTAPYPLDTVNLTTGLSSLVSLVNSGSHNVRLVMTTDETGLATFFSSKAANATNATYGDARPQLTLTTSSVPEPATMALGLLVIPAIMKRRRK